MKNAIGRRPTEPWPKAVGKAAPSTTAKGPGPSPKGWQRTRNCSLRPTKAIGREEEQKEAATSQEKRSLGQRAVGLVSKPRCFSHEQRII